MKKIFHRRFQISAGDGVRIKHAKRRFRKRCRGLFLDGPPFRHGPFPLAPFPKKDPEDGILGWIGGRLLADPLPLLLP